MGSPTRRARLAGWEQLEARDQPAAGLLGNLGTLGASAFAPWELTGGPATAMNGRVFFTAADGPSSIGLYSSDGTAAGTTKISDITPTAAGEVPTFGLFPATTPVAAVGGKVYFSRTDAAGSELWTSDGTAAGTRRVVDLNPGAAGSQPSQFSIVNGRLVFSTYMPVPGEMYSSRQWYSTDGTAAGTVPLFPTGLQSLSEPAFTGGKLYFTSTAMTAPLHQPVSTIWESDGTAAGTKPFVTLPENFLPDSFAGGNPNWAAMVNGKLYFSASEIEFGHELWVSDGTVAGTHLVKDIDPTFQNSFPIIDFHYPNSSDPQQFAVLGNTLYFAADDGAHGQELWKSDGTEAGTVKVTDLSPGVGSPGYELAGTPSGSRITGLTAINGKLYFSANDGVHGLQLFSSDGTAAGTLPLTSVSLASPLSPLAGEAPTVLAAVNSRVLFSFTDASGVLQLWATDGTAAGTAVVKPTGTGTSPFGRIIGGPASVGVIGNTFLYSADDGTSGRQLWATDGTAANTRMVKRLNPSDLGSDPAGFVAVGANAFFTASSSPGLAGVYVTDGTSAPRLLKQVGADSNSPVVDTPGQITASGGRAFFLVQIGYLGRQLWVSDGTVAGTRLLKEIAQPANMSGSPNLTGINNLVDAAGTLYFTVDLPGSGQQIWKSDGTPVGTKLVSTFNPKSSSESPVYIMPGIATYKPVRQLTAVGTRVYFAASDSTSGEELWTSDGTAAGTKRVKDIAIGDGGSRPDDLTALNGKLYFNADDGVNGRQLWVSDGTAAGTRLAATITTSVPPSASWQTPPSLGEPEPREMVAAGGKLFMLGYDPVHGRQLWVSDGTAAGAARLTDTGVGSPMNGPDVGKDAAITGLTAVGSKVYFVAGDATNGRQLWVSNGTAAGTKMVKAVSVDPRAITNSPGWQAIPKRTDPVVVAAVGDRVVFSADDGKAGRELWVTDGTAAGTRLLADIAPGKASGVGTPDVNNPVPPQETAAVVGGRLVFAASDGPRGREPWSMSVADFTPVPPPPAVPPTSPSTSPPTSPPASPPAVPPTSPPVVPPTTPTAKAALTRVFALKTTEGTAATHTLATANLPDGPVYRVTVFWGDGRTAVGTLTRTTGTAFTISAAHTYPYAGDYAVMIRVTADFKTVLSIDTTATVADARFYAGRVAQRMAAGEFFGVVGTIQDMNPTGGRATDFTATIDWGGGRKSEGIVRKTAAGKFEIVGRNTFEQTGRTTATVTIRSSGGGTAIAVSLFTIDPARLPPPA